jgi:hypothetical protein
MKITDRCSARKKTIYGLNMRSRTRRLVNVTIISSKTSIYPLKILIANTLIHKSLHVAGKSVRDSSAEPPVVEEETSCQQKRAERGRKNPFRFKSGLRWACGLWRQRRATPKQTEIRRWMLMVPSRSNVFISALAGDAGREGHWRRPSRQHDPRAVSSC